MPALSDGDVYTPQWWGVWQSNAALNSEPVHYQVDRPDPDDASTVH